MTKDFSKYQKIINQFRGQVSNSDFEAQFLAKTKLVPKTERFLLKMELKRLAQPCTRLIDLRGHVDGECRTFEHDSRIHFLDDVAIKVFQDSINYYGSYTFGVYESVKNTENNFRVIYQNEQANVSFPSIEASASLIEEKKVLGKTQYPATLYQFGQYFNRIEERMNFSIPLSVLLSNQQTIDTSSSDISVNGCRLRFNAIQNIRVGEQIQLKFVGLEKEFEFGREADFPYAVKNIQIDGTTQMVGLQRIYDKEIDGFKKFLKGFIQGNKRRYKINLENTIQALQARSLEQFSLPKLNELPVYLENKAGELLPRYALTSNNNQAVFQYWQDEKRQSTLHFLINENRLIRLKKNMKLGRSLLVYSFIHQSHGHHFFYTADEYQLKEDKDFMQKFLGFAASKSTFAITDLNCIDLDKSRAYSPLTLSESLEKKDDYLNSAPSDEVKLMLSKLPYIVVASDVTHEKLLSDYQQCSYTDINLNQLKSFGHRRITKPVMVDELGINYKNQRQESRFKYKTPATVESSGVTSKGVSHDFSISGLKIELDSPVILAKGDVVKLTFPSLQKITSEFDLKQLPYEVVRINKKKTIINLRVYVKQHQHIGRAFFKLLIDKNRSKLTPDEYAIMIPGLAKALRTLYANSLKIPSLIIQSSGSRYKIESLACSGEFGKLMPTMRTLSDRPKFYNLYPLLSNLQATSLMSSTLKKLSATDAPTTDILYIAINPNVELVDEAVTTKLDSELKTLKLKKIFISNALKRGSFFCFQVKLSRTDEPDMDHLNPELSYIGSYAIHRGKQIEQDIWSVSGVIQLFDITNEAMIRHQFVPVDNVQNQRVTS